MLEKRASEIYVYANNHYAGHGPTTIGELMWRVVDYDHLLRTVMKYLDVG